MNDMNITNMRCAVADACIEIGKKVKSANLPPEQAEVLKEKANKFARDIFNASEKAITNNAMLSGLDELTISKKDLPELQGRLIERIALQVLRVNPDFGNVVEL